MVDVGQHPLHPGRVGRVNSDAIAGRAVASVGHPKHELDAVRRHPSVVVAQVVVEAGKLAGALFEQADRPRSPSGRAPSPQGPGGCRRARGSPLQGSPAPKCAWLSRNRLELPVVAVYAGCMNESKANWPARAALFCILGTVLFLIGVAELLGVGSEGRGGVIMLAAGIAFFVVAIRIWTGRIPRAGQRG